MYQISREKMPELLAAVAKEMDLFLPVQNNGITNFGFWTEDAKVDLDTLKTVKSPKDAFFPQSEVLYSCYQKANKTSIEPAALKDAPFAIFGVRPCDVRAFDVLDRVFLSEPADVYYAARREHGIVVSLACHEPEDSCFCKTFGIDAAEPQADVAMWQVADGYAWEAKTEKGEKLTELVKEYLTEQDLAKEVEAESVAYCVCSSFGLDTSDYSFPYIAGWSSSREMKEMKASMDVIRKTAGEMIDQLTEELEIILEEKQKTELHEKYGILVDALEAAGYRYDYRESEPGHIVLAPDGTHEIAGYLQFESWGDIKDWLEDTIAEGTDISERVDRALYPFKFDYTLEEEMFRGNGDRYAIYHVDEGTPGKQHLFMNMAMAKEDGITIDAANYKCVYSGRLHENEKLDDLYAVFNDNPPADYKAHSMSVSDVIITNRGGDMQAYYVDRFGFAELPDFAAQREKILDIVPEIENVDYENDLTCISFYAAECAEFPVMGEVHYDLTLPEALEAYEKIPSERMHGLKCVGFDLKDGSDYEGMQSLMIEGKIQKEFLNSIPGFRENSYVQNAISRVEKYLEERHPNVENPLESNKKVDNEKNISKEKNEKELNIQMKPIPKKKRGEMSL